MELTQLKYFVAIAETLSFTDAAARVHVSQPALSYQMKKLEEELGTRLFERKGRTITLTADGELFLPLSQGLLSRASEAIRLLRNHSGIETGEVRMGANPSVAAYLMPSLIGSFHQVFPRVRIEMVEGADLDLAHRVHTGALDFAVVTAPGPPQTLEVVPLGKEDLLVITPPGHRLTTRPVVDLGELAGEDFVLPDTTFNLTLQIIDACRRAGFEPRVAYQAGSLHSVKNFVRQGLGISIVPELAVEGLGCEGLAVLGVKGGLTRELSLIRGRDRSVNRAAQVLMMHVRASVAQHMRNPAPGLFAHTYVGPAGPAGSAGEPGGAAVETD